jgi:uncharacterized protein (TIGR03435 family)
MAAALVLSLMMNATAQMKPLAFEVASVKQSRPGALRGPAAGGPRGCNGTVPQIDRARFAVTNISLYMLITWAYGMGNCLNVASYDLITGGEKWTESDLFDVEGVFEDGKGNYNFGQLVFNKAPHLAAMIQTLLAERFKLAVHREAREMPVYALTVAKDGPKLRQLADADCAVRPSDDVTRSGTKDKPWCGEGLVGIGSDRKGTADLRAMTLDLFCERLGLLLDRPVINETGISGMVAFHLEWVQEEGMSTFVRMTGGGRGTVPAVPEIRGHSVFSAIQEQVGLRLEAQRDLSQPSSSTTRRSLTRIKRLERFVIVGD